MKLAKRLEVLKQLREWLLTEDVDWKQVSKQAYEANKWFTKEFVKHRIDCLVNQYLDTEKLELWVKHYHIDDNITPKKWVSYWQEISHWSGFMIFSVHLLPVIM